jgi:hypothetical protein
MRNSRMALAVASAVPLALCGAAPAFAQTAESADALECMTSPPVRKRYMEHINNYQFWSFRPCPQRTCIAELKWAL